MEIKNKKANFDYFIEETIECGIELKGTEIKSLRNGSGDLKDTFALIRNDEVFLHNMYIAKYEEGNIFNHDEKRDRTLLAHNKEIRKLGQKVKMEGLTIVPLTVYLNEGLCKIEIALCKGKKLTDKREALKETYTSQGVNVNKMYDATIGGRDSLVLEIINKDQPTLLIITDAPEGGCFVLTVNNTTDKTKYDTTTADELVRMLSTSKRIA